jgi:hypothetical protein
MKNQDYIKVLTERKKELQEELDLVNRLLGNVSNDVGNSDTSGGSSGENFPVIVSDKSRSAVARVKSAVKKLLEHDVSLQIEDIRANLDRMGVDYNKSAIHNAFKSMRESGDLVSYKINGSNHLVYYMNPEGRDDSIEDFPIKPEYRPENISADDVESLEFKDE